MIEKLIIIGIVGLSALFIARRFWRQVKGGAPGCGCNGGGCGGGRCGVPAQQPCRQKQ